MNPGEHLVIVGGGPAGLSTARSYRNSGGRARVTILAAEPYPPYRRPPLTKEYLRGEIERDEFPIREPEWYEENDIKLCLAESVTTLDRDRAAVETESGEKIPYDALVLATGSEPVRIPVPGADDPEVVVMRTIENSTRLQERVGEGGHAVVVRSGFIGCEAAASLSLRGVKVALISLEELPQITRLDEEAGRRTKGWLEGYGVELHLGVGLESIKRRGDGYEVGIEGGDTIPTGTILFGAGVRPRTWLAEEAGLEILEDGIVADSSMRTSAPGIFAVGDISFAYNESAGRHLPVEHWGEALNHGGVAGTVIAGGEAVWDVAPGFGSTIGDKTIKYFAWGDGYEESRFVDHGDGVFTVWYGTEGVCVGVLTHRFDEGYERGRELVESKAALPR